MPTIKLTQAAIKRAAYAGDGIPSSANSKATSVNVPPISTARRPWRAGLVVTFIRFVSCRVRRLRCPSPLSGQETRAISYDIANNIAYSIDRVRPALPGPKGTQ